METLKFILVIIAAYVMGSLSISIFMSSRVLGRDIRRAGSGNAGATNMARVYGMSAGVLTLGGDMCKTAAAMLLGYLVLGDRGMAAAGMACMAGHCYPLLHGFQGRQGSFRGCGDSVVHRLARGTADDSGVRHRGAVLEEGVLRLDMRGAVPAGMGAGA